MMILLKTTLEVAIRLLDDSKLIIAAHCRAGKG
jgi:hypothetical protein